MPCLYIWVFIVFGRVKRIKSEGESVAIAGDLRPSTGRIMAAVAQAIRIKDIIRSTVDVFLAGGSSLARAGDTCNYGHG